MFYLYFNRELIATSEKFSEIADIIIDEILKHCQFVPTPRKYLDKIMNEIIEHHYGSFQIPGFEDLVEVYHGRCLS